MLTEGWVFRGCLTWGPAPIGGCWRILTGIAFLSMEGRGPPGCGGPLVTIWGGPWLPPMGGSGRPRACRAFFMLSSEGTEEGVLEFVLDVLTCWPGWPPMGWGPPGKDTTGCCCSWGGPPAETDVGLMTMAPGLIGCCVEFVGPLAVELWRLGPVLKGTEELPGPGPGPKETGLGPPGGSPGCGRWFLWSGLVFRGRQTGQSDRLQFFQWHMICLDDEQCGTGHCFPCAHEVIWLRTFFMVLQCGRVHWKKNTRFWGGGQWCNADGFFFRSADES